MQSLSSSVAAGEVQPRFLVHYFDHHQDVLTRYGGRFTLSTSSICLPIDSMPRDSGRKRTRARAEGHLSPPELQWRSVTDLVAVEASIQRTLNDDRALCSSTLFTCKQKILELQALHRSMAHFSCQADDDEDVQSISSLDQGGDPTETFQRLMYNENSTVWTSLFGRLAIPDDSAFSMGRISEVLRSVARIADCQQRYSVIVADPPWPNRSVRRGGKYNCMSLEDIRDLGPSVQELASRECCILALWVTNDPAVVEFAINTLLPAWGFEYASTWWWLKVTAVGRPVCSTGGSHKNPYERIIISTRQSARILQFDRPPPDALSICAHGPPTGGTAIKGEAAPFPYSPMAASDCHSPVGLRPVPWRCLVSTPLRHSWKPPVHTMLSDILTMAQLRHRPGSGPNNSILPEVHTTLELFARELRSHCTSIGDEAALFQQISSANGSPASETAGVPSDGFLSELSDEYADGSSSPLDL